MSAHGHGVLPTFFIVGAPKAGTTSLHHYLEQHPEIQMSAVKEPSFFAPSSDPLTEGARVARRDDYEALYDPAMTVRGDASPSYAMYPLRQGVPDRIKELVPDAKLVYVVRDPIERTISHYHQLVATSGERRPLEEALGDLGDPRSPCVCASLYALQLELYLRRFTQDQVLVIDQADLLMQRRPTLKKVFEFLEVDSSFESQQFDIEFLKSAGRRTYPPGFTRFMMSSVRPRSQWIPPRIRRSLRLSVERVLLPPLEMAELDDHLRSRLEDLYAGENQRLRSLTGKAFSAWSV